jgi:hypothetical protein
MSRSAIERLVRDIRMAVARAKRVTDKTGRYDATTVTITMPRHVASIAADRLEMTQDRLIANAKFRGEMCEIAEIAEDAMRDSALRFNYAISDLEMLLMEFIGRPMMTMQEVREQRQITEMQPSPGPQPFIRKKPAIKASNELTRSIRTGKIGDPRNPGEEG